MEVALVKDQWEAVRHSRTRAVALSELEHNSYLPLLLCNNSGE